MYVLTNRTYLSSRTYICGVCRYTHVHMYQGVYIYIYKHACCVILHVCMDLCTSYHSFTRVVRPARLEGE